MFKKLFGLLIILLIVSMGFSDCVIAVDPDSDEGKVESIEASIRSTSLKDFENNTDFQNLSNDTKNVFRYVYAVTGKDMAITTEVWSQMGNIWNSNDKALYSLYVNGNATVREDIKNNSYYSQRIGYLHTYVSKWQHLSTAEKVAFFNTEKNDYQGALRIFNKASTTEMMYINGNMLIQENTSVADTGWTAVVNGFDRLSATTSRGVTKEDEQLFDEATKEFTASVYRYHREYQILDAATKSNVTTALKNILLKNPNQVDVRRNLNLTRNKMLDEANALYKMSSGAVINEYFATAGGSAFIIAGVVCIVIGAMTSPVGTPTILAGIGLIGTGIFLLTQGTPNLMDNVDIKALSTKMLDFMRDQMSPVIDYLIANLGNQTTTH
jgi:hypothetical protein